MVLSRVQTLVQLNDGLIALLDARAAREGTSRSHLIRRAIELYMREDTESALDAAMVAGYTAQPADPPEAAMVRRAMASIEEEPW